AFRVSNSAFGLAVADTLRCFGRPRPAAEGAFARFARFPAAPATAAPRGRAGPMPRLRKIGGTVPDPPVAPPLPGPRPVRRQADKASGGRTGVAEVARLPARHAGSLATSATPGYGDSPPESNQATREAPTMAGKTRKEQIEAMLADEPNDLELR